MNAPVSEQVKAEAAKSLLERVAEKTKLVKFFRYNASAKHGVPIDPEKEFDIKPCDTPIEQAPQPEPTQNVVQIVKTDDHEKSEREQALEVELQRLRQAQQQQPQQQAQPASQPQSGGMSDKVKGALQTLAVLGGLGAAGYVGSQMTKEDPQQPQVTAPYYSPYQHLEDIGEHLP